MWPSTPAGRQRLAWRRRTCCLRRFAAARPPRCYSFEAQSHTPHDCCVRFVAAVADGTSRNTRYQAGATPYLDRTFAGWIAPASPGARKTEIELNGAAGDPAQALQPVLNRVATRCLFRVALGEREQRGHTARACLRARGERPCCCRAAEKGNELASSHCRHHSVEYVCLQLRPSIQEFTIGDTGR